MEATTTDAKRLGEIIVVIINQVDGQYTSGRTTRETTTHARWSPREERQPAVDKTTPKAPARTALLVLSIIPMDTADDLI